MTDEVDLAGELVEKEIVRERTIAFQRKRRLEDLTDNERAQLESARRLRTTAHNMLRDCDDPRVIPTLKNIYFETIKQYKAVYRRLGIE